jgi:hypothetical protein
MLALQFPEPDFRIRTIDGREQVFDSLRKKWLLLTPEEWVRQNFVRYLTIVRKYPATLIAMEKELKLGELIKRFDILVYDKQHRPWMMIECKAMEVTLNESTLDQILRYNISIPVPFLIITNGKYCYGWERREGALEMISAFPDMY